VTSGRWWRTWTSSTVAGLSSIDVVAAVLLSALAAGMTSGVLQTSYHAPDEGLAAAIGVLPMTAPVAWRRRWPEAAAATLAVAAIGNGLLFGLMVRCGATLPAVFLVAFSVGEYLQLVRSLVVFVLCAANVVAECFYDAKLGPGEVPALLVILAGFFVAGRLVRARTQAAATLRNQSVELRRQRAATAEVAVNADRARMAGDLDSALRGRLDDIASVAAVGRDAAHADPTMAHQALRDIEDRGRQILHHMREMVGTYREAATEPQPTLAGLPQLVARMTSADARVTMEGTPRPLPAALELSAVRIIEHLLLTLEDAPTAIIGIRLRFESEAIELHVDGSPATQANPAAALDAARQRAALHGGTVEWRSSHGRYSAAARLPLVSNA
jgi:signal transduction histidine kinase